MKRGEGEVHGGVGEEQVKGVVGWCREGGGGLVGIGVGVRVRVGAGRCGVGG